MLTAMRATASTRPGWDTALAGVTLDFGVKWRFFPGVLATFALRHKIPNMNAVTTAEPVVHLYAALGLSPAVYLYSALAIVETASASSRRFTQTYDASGNVPWRTTLTTMAMASKTRSRFSTYDAESRLLTQTVTPTRMDGKPKLKEIVATSCSRMAICSRP